MEVNVKTKYICQAYFSFHTATHSKEVIPCQVLVAWQRKVFIIMEKRGKMLPLSPASYSHETEFPAYIVTKMTYNDRMKNQPRASCLLLSDIKEICTSVK